MSSKYSSSPVSFLSSALGFIMAIDSTSPCARISIAMTRAKRCSAPPPCPVQRSAACTGLRSMRPPTPAL
eukprot:366482-Chlamydomonas_euryale.AAC.6